MLIALRQVQLNMFQAFDKLEIVTVQQILDGVRMNLPLVEEITKKAQKAKKDDQPDFFADINKIMAAEAEE